MNESVDEGTVKIQLVPEGEALIDEADRERVEAFRWNRFVTGRGTKVYARANVPVALQDSYGKKQILMQQLVARAPRTCRIAHINKDGLDCRRENLKIYGEYTKEFVGYWWDIGEAKWHWRVGMADGDEVVPAEGYTDDEYDAALAHDFALVEQLGWDGANGRTNLPVVALRRIQARQRGAEEEGHAKDEKSVEGPATAGAEETGEAQDEDSQL